ncbi:YdcH family protein [Enterovirga sp. CN4-39]|uniref:YdcH family protein n=1 Tax=Enterovirga sp. CN4-39 TaxID=3400910 RepID=UPI003C053CFC
MPLQNHLSELERRHEALEREIHGIAARPSADPVRVAELKRRKLQLKDEIYRLKRPSH